MIVKAPCGVPPCCVGGGLVVLEVLLPQEVHSNAIGRTTAAVRRRRLRGIRASLQKIAQTRRYAKNDARSFPKRIGETNRRGATSGKKERAVVESVTVAIAGSLPFRVTCEGEIEQVLAAGAPPQLSVTVPLNPPTGVMEVV